MDSWHLVSSLLHERVKLLGQVDGLFEHWTLNINDYVYKS